MSLDQDKCMVNEARFLASERSFVFPFGVFSRVRRLESALKNVCSAFFSLEQAHKSASHIRLMIDNAKQVLAHVLCQHAEDKDNLPFAMDDDEYSVGIDIDDLCEMVEKRVNEIVSFRDVLARKLRETREEMQREIDAQRDTIKLLMQENGSLKTRLDASKEEYRSLIEKLKDVLQLSW